MTHEEYIRLRQAGLCVMCRGPVEGPGFATCSRCRRRQAEANQAYREEQKLQAQQEKERNDALRQIEKCERCVWGEYVGANTIYCMFPQCVKIRKGGTDDGAAGDIADY